MKTLEQLEATLRQVREELEKSNYGKRKGGSEYNQADNARRKANNTGDQIPGATNVNVKAISTKPGQMSAKASAATQAKKDKKKSADMPVKIYSPEEKAALAEKLKLSKATTIKPDKGYGKIIHVDNTPKPSTGTVKIKDTATPKPVVFPKINVPPKVNTMKKEDLEKDFANKDLSDKNKKIKDLQTKIDTGTYKPKAEDIADKILKEEEFEVLHCSINGQWSLHKAKRGAYQKPSVANAGKDVVGRIYSGVAGSSKQQLFHEGKQLQAKNANQPVKVYNEQEKAVLASKMNLNKK